LRGFQSLDTFTISAKMRTQDIWFLLVISVILPELQYVGEISSFKTDIKPVAHSRYRKGRAR
jgi:hypothetical protein